MAFPCIIWRRALPALVLGSVAWGPGAPCSAQSLIDMDNAHCGKKFRIATHVSPPFIIIDDVTKCVDQKCGPEAFGANGGIVYKLMMEHVLPQLRKYCRESGYPDSVDFDWYLPPLTVDWSSSEKAVEMVCHGQFHRKFLQPLSAGQPFCPAGAQYKGPSPSDAMAKAGQRPTCSGAYAPESAGCVSSGPDLALGAVHVTGDNLHMLDFSVPYLAVEQVVVKRKVDQLFMTIVQERIDDIFAIFLPMTFGAWMLILAEMVLMTCILLIVEATIFKACCSCCRDTLERNDTVAPGFHALIDCWYWAFSMSFDPGGSGKSPKKAAGRINIVVHCFFVVIIVASYTGSVGPAIYSTSLGVIKSLDTLKYGGKVTVGVVGPRWDPDAKEPPYLGKIIGTAVNLSRSVGDLDPGALVPESVQFKMLQAEMKADQAASFKIVTGSSMHTTGKDFKPILHTKEQDPCVAAGRGDISLGIFDLIRCRFRVNNTLIQSTIYDAPRVVFEMMQRYNNTGSCSLVAVGNRFGQSSYAIGFPKNTSLPQIFSRAIERVKFKGIIENLLQEAQLYDMHNKCRESDKEPESLTVSLLSGLFLLVFSLIVVGVLFSCLARTCNLPISTLSDEDLRRSKEKDTLRDWISAKEAEAEAADAAVGRKHRKPKRMRLLTKEEKKEQMRLTQLRFDDSYKPSYKWPEQPFTNMGSLPTKNILVEVQDFCDHFHGELLFEPAFCADCAVAVRRPLLTMKLQAKRFGHQLILILGRASLTYSQQGRIHPS